MELHKKRIRWGRILITFLLAFGFGVGFLGGRLVKALDGDPKYWTVTNGDLSLTIVNVSQNGLDLAPEWSDYIYNDNAREFGNYYFPVANNTDKVGVNVLVNGMKDGESYKIFNEQTITSEDNGNVFFSYIEPGVTGYTMQDSVECWYEEEMERCSVDPSANEYAVGVYLQNENDWSDGVSKQLIVRPAEVGSQNVEIISVKQNGEDVFLDTEGWHVTSWEEAQETLQTINEYRLDDYNAPVTITYKLKNLEIGKNYAVGINGDYNSFKADATEKIETKELELNLADKHVNTSIVFYTPGSYEDSESIHLYFRVADENFVPLGDIIVDEIRQGGEKVEPTSNVSAYSREYTFNVNDAQPLEVDLHAVRATADLDYYISYSMYGNGGGYLSSDAPIVVSGEELEGGTVLMMSAGFGMSEGSPFTLNFTINTVGAYAYNYGSQNVYYENYGPSRYNSDYFKVSFYEDENIPRYGASMYYTGENAPELDSDMINAKYHDAEHPLMIRIEGENYDEERVYNIDAEVKADGVNYYSEVFTATGAELNEGKEIVIEGLTLSLPEFDPSGGTSGYDLAYEFSLEIDGLKQKGEMYYVYDGWLNSMMTYNGGEVATIGAGDGMIPSMYMTTTGMTVRRTSLDGSRNAILHYLGGNFDVDLDYDYALYYNDNVGEDWWMAEAGTIIDEGSSNGGDLNGEGFSVGVDMPGNESEGVMYSLVITRNGGLVTVARDYISFTDEPELESFKFSADSDSFMQTGIQEYRLAREANAVATLIGSGFEDEEEYRIWVKYDGYHEGEEENEYGYRPSERVDLSELDESIAVTGAELNAGYDYALTYSSAFDEVDFMNVGFAVTDGDAEEPDWYGEGGDSYSGHSIFVEYVDIEDVFRGGGFQIDENGEIIDVSQPGEPEEPVEIPLDIRTPSDVDVIPEGGTLTVVSEKPVVVLGLRNDEWVVLYAWDVVTNDEERTNHYSIGDCDEVKIVLKGDGDMDGAVTPADLNRMNRSLISPTLGARYRALTDVERLIFDLDNDGNVTPADLNAINRSLISPTLGPRYRQIQW